MFEVARESQLLAGRIAVNACSGPPFDVRAALCAGLSAPANDLERYLLEGLIARAEQEFHRRCWLQSSDGTFGPIPARASSILRTRLSEPWTIATLARELFTNRVRLTTEFKEAFGVGVHHYLIECRIRAAEERLRRGQKVEAVCAEVGFRSKKTLYDAYKRVRGKALRVSNVKSLRE
jgi:AraC-like DNA-binding protein